MLRIVMAVVGLAQPVAARAAPVPGGMVGRVAEVAPPLPAIAGRVAECESGNRNVANDEGSPATGFYQASDATWTAVTGLSPPAMAWPREVQDGFFARLWSEPEGWSHWAASRWCWADR